MARGDEDFVAFAQAGSVRLQRAAYLLTGDRYQAEDLAQATLVRVYAAWGRVQRKDPYAYARTVLTNLVTDQWRRPIREYATETMPDRPASQDIADVVAKRRWLIGALQELSPRERAVVVLRHFFDASEAEVARELNLSAGTVKSLNSRALAKLRITAGPVPPMRAEPVLPVRAETEIGAGR